jgi:hypothetical protein
MGWRLVFEQLPISRQKTVLFDQVGERLPLAGVQPAGQDHQQDLEGRGADREVISRPRATAFTWRSARAEEWPQVFLDPERQRAKRALRVHAIVGEQIVRRILEPGRPDRGDHGPSRDCLALAGLQQILGHLLLVTARADAVLAAVDLVSNPPDRGLVDANRVAGGLAPVPGRRRVEPLIARRADPDLSSIDERRSLVLQNVERDGSVSATDQDKRSDQHDERGPAWAIRSRNRTIESTGPRTI